MKLIFKDLQHISYQCVIPRGKDDLKSYFYEKHKPHNIKVLLEESGGHSSLLSLSRYYKN